MKQEIDRRLDRPAPRPVQGDIVSLSDNSAIGPGEDMLLTTVVIGSDFTSGESDSQGQIVYEWEGSGWVGRPVGGDDGESSGFLLAIDQFLSSIPQDISEEELLQYLGLDDGSMESGSAVFDAFAISFDLVSETIDLAIVFREDEILPAPTHGVDAAFVPLGVLGDDIPTPVVFRLSGPIQGALDALRPLPSFGPGLHAAWSDSSGGTWQIDATDAMGEVVYHVRRNGMLMASY